METPPGGEANKAKAPPPPPLPKVEQIPSPQQQPQQQEKTPGSASSDFQAKFLEFSQRGKPPKVSETYAAAELWKTCDLLCHTLSTSL